MTIVDGSIVDLTFYYSLRLPSTIINIVKNGNDIIQTTNGFIFADSEYKNPIGKFAFNINVYDVFREDIPIDITKPRTFQVTGTNVYFLPQGTLSNSINLFFIKNAQGDFIVPSDSTNVYQILSGSGHFLNASGFIVQLTDNFLGREMLVYFDK